ncbi:MAG: AAA family ATPase [Candidatus Coproplasma sp.]
MRFYEVRVETNFSLKEENDKEVSVAEISRKTATFSEEYEGRACAIMATAKKEVALAVCLLSNDIKPATVAEKFLKRLGIEYSSIKLKEISLTNFMHDIDCSLRNRLIDDKDRYIFMMGIKSIIDDRTTFYYDKIVGDDKSVKDLKADVDKYHLCDEYEAELNRILSGKKRGAFVGNPANYFMMSKDDTARRAMARDLISALYRRGRLQSKRYTIINLDDCDSSIEGLEEFYRINEGATVLIKIFAHNFCEGQYTFGAVDIKKVCEIIRQKGSKTLTIFSMDTPSDKNRNKLENYMLGIPFIVFTDKAYSKQTACEQLTKMAESENFTISDEVLEKVKNAERGYTFEELNAIYNEWRVKYVGTQVFPEYSKFITHITEEKERNKECSSAYDRLMDMIGLTQAKQVIDGAINYFKMQRELRNRGLEFNRPAMHMCFTGSPGTAKTTVARLVAQILKDNGILSEGRLIEVGRSQLVGKYVGHTAPKVKELFERARGSVLFIDEAYSLIEDKKGMYGSEAINTIVQEMENCRENTVVILAGYPDEMNELLEWNPGLKSRIAFHVSFDDYTEEELLEITKLFAKDYNMLLAESAESKLLSIYAQARKNKGFGNGRFARNLIEKAKLNQANRLMKKDMRYVSDEEIRTLTAEDFDYEFPQDTRIRLGFAA